MLSGIEIGAPAGCAWGLDVGRWQQTRRQNDEPRAHTPASRPSSDGWNSASGHWNRCSATGTLPHGLSSVDDEVERHIRKQHDTSSEAHSGTREANRCLFGRYAGTEFCRHAAVNAQSMACEALRIIGSFHRDKKR
eukprot:TRINITY_DN3019_c0_g2_i2.p1 TRINITY_DN3019_c0_g2~~TRINITY_DN3019_c0_g2_i2.p1  ORF type:complete len:136 (-),score=3.74 TRINITY_DN3019_c0_g2_i2:1267-1674(-)